MSRRAFMRSVIVSSTGTESSSSEEISESGGKRLVGGWERERGGRASVGVVVVFVVDWAGLLGLEGLVFDFD